MLTKANIMLLLCVRPPCLSIFHFPFFKWERPKTAQINPITLCLIEHNYNFTKQLKVHRYTYIHIMTDKKKDSHKINSCKFRVEANDENTFVLFVWMDLPFQDFVFNIIILQIKFFNITFYLSTSVCDQLLSSLQVHSRRWRKCGLNQSN